MAVSGRKLSDFEGSMSRGSAEDFDHTCDPCLDIGQHIEAHGYCVDCQEYLCKNCYDYHQRIKATKNHQLVNKQNMDKQAIPKKESEEYTEKCQVHKKEVIKFFCPVHEALGCNDCIILNHRTCDIDYIPDKCAGIGDSQEFRQVLNELDQKVNEAENLIKIAARREKEIDSCHEGLLKDITKFRKEINDCLDQLQKKIQADAGIKKLKDKQTVRNVLETCTKRSQDMKQLQSSLTDSKASQQNGKLYIMVKQAKSKLKSDEIQEADNQLKSTSIQYIFEKSDDLEKMLSRQNAFGKLSISTSLVTSKTITIDKLTHEESINIRTKSDKNRCLVSGCVVLSSRKLVLADYNNNKLKVVDTQRKAVIEEKTLDSEPWDIAVLPGDNIAVTIPEQKQIHIMKTGGNMSLVRRIPMRGKCRGLTYHQGQLYVLCWDPHSVVIVDTQGQLCNTISLGKDKFYTPNYTQLGNDLTFMYISNYESHCVSRVTLRGDISAEYKNNDLQHPRGMVMLDDGSFLVCCTAENGKGSLHRISSDFKQGQKVIDDMWYPQSVCYNLHEQKVYIGYQSDELIVLSVK